MTSRSKQLITWPMGPKFNFLHPSISFLLASCVSTNSHNWSLVTTISSPNTFFIHPQILSSHHISQCLTTSPYIIFFHLLTKIFHILGCLPSTLQAKSLRFPNWINKYHKWHILRIPFSTSIQPCMSLPSHITLSLTTPLPSPHLVASLPSRCGRRQSLNFCEHPLIFHSLSVVEILGRGSGRLRSTGPNEMACFSNAHFSTLAPCSDETDFTGTFRSSRAFRWWVMLDRTRLRTISFLDILREGNRFSAWIPCTDKT